MSSNTPFTFQTRIGPSVASESSDSAQKLIDRQIRSVVSYLLAPSFPGSTFAEDFFHVYRTLCTPLKLLESILLRIQSVSFEDDPTSWQSSLSVLLLWVQQHRFDFESPSSEIYERLMAFLRLYMKEIRIKPILVQIESLLLSPVSIPQPDPSSLEMPHIPKMVPCHFLKIHPEEIARQITLIQFESFTSLSLYKCLQRSASLAEDPSYGLNFGIDSSTHSIGFAPFPEWNALSQRIARWFATQVVREAKLPKRIKIISFIVDVASYMLKISNYEGFNAVLEALALLALPQSWSGVSQKCRSLHDSLIASRNSYSDPSNISKSLSINIPCIPILDVHIQQLVVIAQNQSKFLPERGTAKSRPSSAAIPNALEKDQQITQISSSTTNTALPSNPNTTFAWTTPVLPSEMNSSQDSNSNSNNNISSNSSLSPIIPPSPSPPPTAPAPFNIGRAHSEAMIMAHLRKTQTKAFNFSPMIWIRDMLLEDSLSIWSIQENCEVLEPSKFSSATSTRKSSPRRIRSIVPQLFGINSSSSSNNKNSDSTLSSSPPQHHSAWSKPASPRSFSPSGSPPEPSSMAIAFSGLESGGSSPTSSSGWVDLGDPSPRNHSNNSSNCNLSNSNNHQNTIKPQTKSPSLTHANSSSNLSTASNSSSSSISTAASVQTSSSNPTLSTNTTTSNANSTSSINSSSSSVNSAIPARSSTAPSLNFNHRASLNRDPTPSEQELEQMGFYVFSAPMMTPRTLNSTSQQQQVSTANNLNGMKTSTSQSNSPSNQSSQSGNPSSGSTSPNSNIPASNSNTPINIVDDFWVLLDEDRLQNEQEIESISNLLLEYLPAIPHSPSRFLLNSTKQALIRMKSSKQAKLFQSAAKLRWRKDCLFAAQCHPKGLKLNNYRWIVSDACRFIPNCFNLQITNSSSALLEFDFDSGIETCSDLFLSFNPSSGTLASGKSLNIKIVLVLLDPIQFHRVIRIQSWWNDQSFSTFTPFLISVQCATGTGQSTSSPTSSSPPEVKFMISSPSSSPPRADQLVSPSTSPMTRSPLNDLLNIPNNDSSSSSTTTGSLFVSSSSLERSDSPLPSPRMPPVPSHFWKIPMEELNLLKRIGGNAASVYLAKLHGADVVLKKWDIGLLDSMPMEFLVELDAHRTMKHPNLVHFIGGAASKGSAFIVLEYVSRGTLTDNLHNQSSNSNLPTQSQQPKPSSSKLSWATKLSIATGIANGMTYMHYRNMMHRDLKSLNILITHDFKAKVADLGSSTALGAATTKRTQGVGTYDWIAPEVLSSKKYTSSADVFSFGLIMWELLHERFPDRSLTDVVAGNIPPIDPVFVTDYPEFVALLQRCCDTKPSSRPNFAEILIILEQLSTKPTVSTPPMASHNNPIGSMNNNNNNSGNANSSVNGDAWVRALKSTSSQSLNLPKALSSGSINHPPQQQQMSPFVPEEKPASGVFLSW